VPDVPRGIFLSYRRADVAPYARLLQSQLRERFPGIHIFMDLDLDLDSSETGSDFAEVIRETVNSCSVLVALIGRQWATIADEQGRRRLDDPDDYVRLEVEAAFERRVRMIPVLVDGARPPRAEQLPAELRRLAQLNALELSYARFQYDVDQLLDLIERVLDIDSDSGWIAAVVGNEPKARVQEAPTNQDADEQIRREADSATPSGGEAQAERETEIQPSQLRQPKIFLCYRREDTQGFARGIYESLASKYGQERVFRDIDSIPAGVRFPAWIKSRVGQCNVMIVLIGDSWLSVKDPTGQRRLDLSRDWVRQEIEVALRRDIPIIPVRLQGVSMPSEDELPPSIADLTNFQSAEVTDSRWAFDVGLLIQAIDNLIAVD
jgi:hypothetical protein